MNNLDLAAIIGDLLPIAESLFSLIDKIKTQAPDVWATVATDYENAVSAWNAAKQSQTAAHDQANEKLASNLVRDTAFQPPQPETVSNTAASLVGKSSAEQAAAGAPLAHYTS